jgi:hypothetical protein
MFTIGKFVLYIKKEDTDDYILYMYDTITEYLNIKVPSMSYVEHIMGDT